MTRTLHVHFPVAVSRVLVVSAVSLLLVVSATPGLCVTPVSEDITTNTTWTLAASPYALSDPSDNAISIAGGVTLTIQPGVVVKFETMTRLHMDGTLNAIGTANSPIRFTSLRDDTVGGDTNGDGGATTPAPGDWDCIWFHGASSSASVMRYCDIRYGGLGRLGALYCDHYYGPADPWIENCAVADSLAIGIRVNQSSPTLEGCIIERSGVGVCCVNQATPLIHHCSISANSTYGVENQDPSVTVDATSNWWGDASGPYDPSDDRASGGLYNPGGKGDRVTNYVLYSSWLPCDPWAVFCDVPRNHWAWRYIEAISREGITTGCDMAPLRYCPNSPVTRGQMAVFVCRAAALTWLDPGAATFVDVPRGADGLYTPPGSPIDGDGTHMFYGWVERLADGASWGGTAPTSGCGGGYYCVDQATTRAQMATFLCRANGKTWLDPGAASFPDVPRGADGVFTPPIAANGCDADGTHQFYGWIERLADTASWGPYGAPTRGFDDGTFRPNNNCTRAEMAVFLCRAFEIPY
jgi:hypothetical protein